MRKIYTKLLLVSFVMLGLFFPGQSNSQILFTEDFDGIGGPTAGGAGTYVFPAGWLLRNVDNGTPAGSVSYVNEAWERREDFANNVADSCAFSTSWNTPVVTANDWMWTPLIGPLPANTSLYWNAITYDPSYPDGYEVRIMTAAQGPPTGGTGVIGNQITGSTTVFSIPAENTTWTARSVSLAAYAGQSIYIAFRNNSTDEFLLLIDDILVEAPVLDDAEMEAADTLEYTIIPIKQFVNIPFDGTIRNGGANNITNAYMEVNVYDGLLNNVFTASSATVATITPGNTANFQVTGFIPPLPDFYIIEYIAKHSVADGQAFDDTLYNGILVDGEVYARDDGTVTGGLGIGAGNGGYLGESFDIVVPDVMDSILVYVTAGYTGEPYAAVVWDMVAGVPNTIVASTDTLLYPDDSADVYILPIHGGAVGLPVGEYVVTFVEFDSTMQLGQTASVFTPGTTWVDWPTNPNGGWANLEVFGVGFERAQVVRPFLACGSYVATLTPTDATCGATNGTATVDITGGPTDSITYLWSNGGTTQTISGLSAGLYTVTVTLFGTCDVTGTVSVNNIGAPTVDSLVVVDALCNGDNGTVTVFASGGTTPYSYLWSNAGITQSISAAAGSYTVTVTDSLGCIVTGGPATINEPAVLSVNINAADAPCFGDDGTASAVVTGGTVSYSFVWSNAATTQNITVAPGSYSVTVTDANGCTATAGPATISQPAAAVSVVVTGTDETAAGANDGTATATPAGGTSPYTYLWSNLGTTQTITGLAPGNYTVTVTDANGCSIVDSISVLADIKSGINYFTMYVFPNPNTGTFTIFVNQPVANEVTVELYDGIGRKVFGETSGTTMNYRKEVNLEGSAAGMYYLHVTSGGTTSVKKIVIK